MLNNPERTEAVQGQIRRAVETLTTQGHKLTKRAVAEAAGCSPTTVMKYRNLWQEEGEHAEGVPAHDLLVLTPENLAAWQELEARFAPMSINVRLQGCRYDQVTPEMSLFWRKQYLRMAYIGKQLERSGLTPKVLRPYRDRLALVEEAVEHKYGRAALAHQDLTGTVLTLPLPRANRFLGLPFPQGLYSSLLKAMEHRHGEVFIDERY